MGEKDNGPSDTGTPGAGGAGAQGPGIAVDPGPPPGGGAGSPKPPVRPPHREMEGTYPDGYKMTYTDPDHFPTLTDPSGRTGSWDSANGRWVDPSGSPMPQGWGNDHVPMDPKPG